VQCCSVGFDHFCGALELAPEASDLVLRLWGNREGFIYAFMFSLISLGAWSFLPGALKFMSFFNCADWDFKGLSTGIYFFVLVAVAVVVFCFAPV